MSLSVLWDSLPFVVNVNGFQKPLLIFIQNMNRRHLREEEANQAVELLMGSRQTDVAAGFNIRSECDSIGNSKKL